MSNTVKLKRSNILGKVPTIDDITAAEVAINTADKKVYFGTGTEVVEILNSTVHQVVQKGVLSIANTGSTTMDSFPTSSANVAEYTIVGTSGSSYQVLKVLILHNNVTPSILEYAEDILGSRVFNVTANITSSQLDVVVSTLVSNSTIKFTKILI